MELGDAITLSLCKRRVTVVATEGNAMKFGSKARFAAMGLACCVALPAAAAPVWDETVAGDFSGNGLVPTEVAMTVGSNIVIGTTGDGGSGIDRDYFQFTVPDGASLVALMLLGNTTVSGSSSFIGIQAGPQLTVSPSGAGAENLLGFAHYGNDLIGQNLLPALAIQFTGALPSGTYSVWVQEIGGPVDYGFDFVISAVPEPEMVALFFAGLLGLAGFHRRFN